MQVNTGSEPQKAGIDPPDAVAFAGRCRDKHGLTIEGFMCIPPIGENPGPHFALLDKLAREAGLAESHAQGRLSLQFVNWILGVALIYGSLFGIGKLIFKEWGTGLLYLLVAIVAGALISRNLSRGEMTAETLQLEHAEEPV